ncbi:MULTISPECIES: ATP-binding protein [unclassified Streptomyces]|uniref:ATP-binding protein n=1 Tax=unclassified Streptomyces TaxID=2593676 RepID=UPI000B88E9D9|nr:MULTISPECIES: ATP-binding protein [unclassified Streptomyces]MYR97525.1 hypothetical protein [Streptomyces sp. SID4937]
MGQRLHRRGLQFRQLPDLLRIPHLRDVRPHRRELPARSQHHVGAIHELRPGGQTLRIEVTETRGDSVPPGPGAVKVPEDEYAVHGRGLLIVEALADHWGVVPGPVPRKTVWAEIDLVR